VKSVYFDIVEWFQDGSKINISDNMKFKDYINELKKVKGLEEFVKKYPQYYETEKELASLMEFVLDGLHQNSKIAKDEMGSGSSYKDMLPAIFSGKDYGLEGLDEEYYR